MVDPKPNAKTNRGAQRSPVFSVSIILGCTPGQKPIRQRLHCVSKAPRWCTQSLGKSTRRLRSLPDYRFQVRTDRGIQLLARRKARRCSARTLQFGRCSPARIQTVRPPKRGTIFTLLWKDAARHSHPEASQGRLREAAIGTGNPALLFHFQYGLLLTTIVCYMLSRNIIIT